eukprot:TRINITY_DN6644_c0_g1_i1.p1 TRINITY_DN6644_c0_g1~~TRINITY_DN6644_c0_g1_i1.p1  ORF type:complete len:116 (+),score=21.21 TRINITY_DN6644_c0_g1_i1:210-557(+)
MQVMLSNYHGRNDLVNTNSPLQAFMRYNNGDNIEGYESACSILDGCAELSASGASKAAALTAKVDVAIVFIGLYPRRNDSNPAMESEGVDRLNLTLPPGQTELLRRFLTRSPTLW